MMKAEKYYTAQEIADLFGVKRGTVWSWIRQGRLEAVHISTKIYRISEEQLRRFRETSSTKQSGAIIRDPVGREAAC